MTNKPQSAKLARPGATLYYERRGKGPTLLIIPGGPQDAGVFDELATRLADRYTVVSYDPRGNSRTTTESAPSDLDMDVQADDAGALIDAIGGGAAFVFGTSGGAQIGLNLAAHHPDKIRALIAHEPPSMMLLDDPEPSLQADRALQETYRRDGVEAAMAQFFGEHGLDGDPSEGGGDGAPDFDMPPQADETFERVSGNFEYWLAHGMIPLSTYVPEVEKLRGGDPRVVVAIGVDTAGQPIEEMSQALAKQLGVDPVAFPGDHMGFETQPDAFAEAIDTTFQEK